MWDTFTPQQQQWLMSLMGGGRGAGPGMQQLGTQPGMNPAAMMPGGMGGQGQPGTLNPLMSQLAGGGMNPQQQAMLQQYLQMLNRPGGFATPGATMQPSPYQGVPIPGAG